MSVEKNNALNFETNKVDLIALQREIDEAVIIEDNKACDRDMLDQMTYQLSIDEKIKLNREIIEKKEEPLEENIEELESKKDFEVITVTAMSDEERDEYMKSLNNAFLDLSRKLKDVTVYYIALKSKVNILESREQNHKAIDQELDNLITQMKSHRRYNDLSEIDFNEVVRRVILEINNRDGVNKKKEKKKKILPWKIILTLLLVGILIWGYIYKVNGVSPNYNMKENYEKK